MIENVFEREQLVGHARARALDVHTKSVNNRLVDEEAARGWSIKRKGKTVSSLSKAKSRPTHLEDRVWTLLYRMGMQHLNGAGGAKLALESRGESAVVNQLDVVGIDPEVAIAIECKSAERFGRRAQFQDELAKFALFRERFIRAVNGNLQWKSDHKRTPLLAFFLENIQLSPNDRERAKASNVLLFDDGDLEYYEKLVAHLGPAAKYQFLADAAAGKSIPGLSIRVPAVKSKMGGQVCYTFPVSPEYLLKIAYVSHRAKGKASDIHAYQRMIAKSRLKKIREYISEKGIFPTNIVLNVEKRFLNFQRVKQANDEVDRDSSGILGWLDIRPAYKSAWVIDGQHRLFAYSGHPRAASSHLSVLAFEGLSPSMQASLFVDINAKQKSVKQSLLQELYAELHWDAESPAIRLKAIVSKAIQVLDADRASPLHGRILTADVPKDPTRCISLTSLFRAIARQDLFLGKEVKGVIVEYGPLWGGENTNTLDRTVQVVSCWLSNIAKHAPEWWALGQADGGGLAMNDGVTALLNVFESVVRHLENDRARLVTRDADDVCALLTPYAQSVGEFLGAFGQEQRKGFRDLRGIQGQTYRTRQMQKALRDRFKNFNPPGLDEFFKRESEQTNLRAKVSIDRIEKMVQAIVVQELRQTFQSDDDAWWFDGVPKSVRTSVAARVEDDGNKRGCKEAYFDFSDYRRIVQERWTVFQNILGYGRKNESKDRQTKWFVEVNDWRNIVAHASSGKTVSVEDLSRLQSYERWIVGRVKGSDIDERALEQIDESDE